MNPLSKLVLFIFVTAIFIECSSTKTVSDPYIAYSQKQYSVAISLFNKEYTRTKSSVAKGKISLYIAESYSKLHDSKNAGIWYKKHYDSTSNFDSLEKYANALKQEGNYKDAQRIFKQLSKQTSRSRYFRKQSQFCNELIEWQKNEHTDFELTPITTNSKYSEYGPVVNNEGLLIYSSDKPTGKNDKFKWSGNGFSKFYSLDLESGKSTLLEGFNHQGNQGTLTFDAEETTMIYTLCLNDESVETNYCKLYSRVQQYGQWSEPELLPFINETQNYVHPSLSDDGQSLYFASNALEGWGKYDIYVSRYENGQWQRPRILSRSINTDKNEMYPFIKNDTLYFSSDGLNGMGGLDLFYATKLKNKKWSTAQNLKSPINSPMDDFGIFVTGTSNSKDNNSINGYLTSNRSSSIGKDDIYSFAVKYTEPPIKEVIVEKIEPIFQLNVNLVDNEGQPITINKQSVILKPNVEPKKTQNYLSYTDIDKSTLYTIIASPKGYLSQSVSYAVPREYWDDQDSLIILEKEIVLQKIIPNKEIVLENVYYDFNKSNLRTDAYPALNKLLNILNDNPTISIQLSAHTDCRGKEAYNLDLSQKRAESVVDYLISQGILSDRLIAKGYGESTPSINCECNDCTDDEHQINRRTSFFILDQ